LGFLNGLHALLRSAPFDIGLQRQAQQGQQRQQAGHGEAGGEIVLIEKDLWPLLQACAKVLQPQPLFVVLNSYTTGLSPLVLQQLLQAMLPAHAEQGLFSCGELSLPISSGGHLPCGTCARFEVS
jgi:hypothetical protein